MRFRLGGRNDSKMMRSRVGARDDCNSARDDCNSARDDRNGVMMDYKNTVFLPQTSFSMKAGLSQLEPQILAYWQELGLYERLREQSKGREKFILHDGPPYANGHLHMGHALNKTLKDVVVRSQQMLGKDAPFIPGWDCHGLPIEAKVEEKYRAKKISKDQVPVLEFRKECRAYASQWIDVQREEFKRLGCLGRWDKPYATMDYTAEAQIIREMGKFLANGSLYLGIRPIMWSVVEKTALAEAEIEYHDHTSKSIYLAFPIQKTPIAALEGAQVVIWTTTVWTIPANRAIAYGEDITYSLVTSEQGRFLIASELLESVLTKLNLTHPQTIETFTGAQLAGVICDHPLKGQGYDFPVPLLPGEHVTTEAGTGFVHTAPGHGIEDFAVGKAHGLEIPYTVQDDGLYAPDIPLFAGTHVFKAADHVLPVLVASGHLLAQEDITHSYPHSWRSKAPLIYRTTPQWFISMDKTGLRAKALAEIAKVNWYPATGANRIGSMVEGRPDWCVSRQRSWGTPIPVFIHKTTRQPLADPKIIERIALAVEKEGADVWFDGPEARFLAPEYNPQDYEAVRDIVDVWFDAGSSQSFVLEKEPEQAWPADLYVEGSDQHRGWFQSSLLVACGTKGQAPFRNVLTHGFLVDEHGRKMSKSLGNTVNLEDVIKNHGADILRLWVVSSDYTQDLRIGPAILKQQEDVYRRLRNTFRYLLGSLEGSNLNASSRALESSELAREKTLMTRDPSRSEASKGDIKDLECGPWIPDPKAHSGKQACHSPKVRDDNENSFEPVPYEQLPELEQWVLGRLYELDQFQRKCHQHFDYQQLMAQLHAFCSSDLSAFYFDIRKDSLYCDGMDSIERRSVLTVLDHVFTCLVTWLAPILCFTTEEVWMTRYGKGTSVHLQPFPTIPVVWHQEALEGKMVRIRNLRRVMTGALEVARAGALIGSSLQANLEVYAAPEVFSGLESVDWAQMSIASQVHFLQNDQAPADGLFSLEDVPGIQVRVIKAEGEKCQRCWKVLPEVGVGHPELCGRCADVV
jgi:isoleucyl-tRNA synthetase